MEKQRAGIFFVLRLNLYSDGVASVGAVLKMENILYQFVVEKGVKNGTILFSHQLQGKHNLNRDIEKKTCVFFHEGVDDMAFSLPPLQCVPFFLPFLSGVTILFGQFLPFLLILLPFLSANVIDRLRSG